MLWLKNTIVMIVLLKQNGWDKQQFQTPPGGLKSPACASWVLTLKRNGGSMSTVKHVATQILFLFMESRNNVESFA